MATVSRLILNHPALGTAGGASLHTSIESLYTKIGDAIDSRWYSLLDFDQTETVDLLHNFQMDIALLRWDLWNFTGGEWVKITATSSPALSAFSVIAKVGFEKTTLQITNNTGGNDLTFAVSIVNDPLYLSEGDVEDVVVTSPSNLQVLTYNAGTSKWENQAPAASKSYTKFVGSTETYATLTAALAAAAAGDRILVRETTAEAGDLTVPANVEIMQMPGATVVITGTFGVIFSGARGKWTNMDVRLNPAATLARGVYITAADCWVSGQLELNTAQTVTDMLHVAAGGVRTYAQLGIKKTLGTITNLETNLDGASKTDVWGG